MGGRGGSSGINNKASKGSTSVSKATAKIAQTNTKFSTSQLNNMSRSQLETVAKAVFIKNNISRGLSAAEANSRASMLVAGNSASQLRKYIKHHG